MTDTTISHKQTDINVRFLYTTTTACTLLLSTSPRCHQNNNNTGRGLEMHYTSSPRYIFILIYISLIIIYRLPVEHEWLQRQQVATTYHSTRMTTNSLTINHHHCTNTGIRTNGAQDASCLESHVCSFSVTFPYCITPFNNNDGMQRGSKERDVTSVVVVFVSGMSFFFTNYQQSFLYTLAGSPELYSNPHCGQVIIHRVHQVLPWLSSLYK